MPNLLVLSLFILVEQYAAVPDHILPGFGQKTIPIPLPSISSSQVSAISVETQGRVLTGLGSQNLNRIFFSAWYRGNLNRWSMSLSNVQGKYTYGSALKTLCIDPGSKLNQQSPTEELRRNTKLESGDDKLYINVYSETDSNVELNVTDVNWSDNFIIRESQTVEVIVDPQLTRVFQFVPPKNNRIFHYGSEDENYLLNITALSNPGKCMFVAINNPGCPWHDEVRTVKTSKLWARMLKTGLFPIRTKDFPNSFTVTLISLEDSGECYTHTNNKSIEADKYIQKLVSIRVQRMMPVTDYTKPVGLAFFIIISAGVFFTLTWCISWHVLNPEVMEGCSRNNGMIHEEDGPSNDPNQETLQTESMIEEKEERNGLIEELRERLMQNHLDEQDHQTGDEIRDFTHSQAAQERLKKTLESDLTVADMSVIILNNDWHRRHRSRVYLYLVPLSCLFYFIPAFQMVYAEYLRSTTTGDQERCVLNFGCSRPFGPFADFNHIISNFGYIFYGLLFIAIVKYRSCKTREMEKQRKQNNQPPQGLVTQYGIFYTLGLCLVFQGLFSFVYHICPSNVNLQFDTSIMKLFMVLIFMKTYQFRHPDTCMNAFNAMYGMFGILFLEACSLYSDSEASKSFIYFICGIFYMLAILHLTVDNYFYGAIKVNYLKTLPILCKYFFTCERFKHPVRFTVSILFILFNVLLLVGIIIKANIDEDGVSSLSSPLLLVCTCNMSIYLGEYLFRKIAEIRRHDGRKILRFFILFGFLLITLILGIIALSFYSDRQQSRKLSPPESRDRNADCNLWGFYDNHDHWHFLSSTGLFLALIFLLTIDDDLINTKRTNIKVF